MLNQREWSPRSDFTPIEQYLFSFTLGPEGRTDMTTVAQDPQRMQMAPSYADDYLWIYPDQEITRVIAEEFKKIAQVKSICAHFGPEEITIWTLLESYNREAREKVYEKELEICRNFGLYDFDFRASSMDLISPEELVRTGSREIFKRK